MGLDDEFVIYDEQGFYDATAEGGSYVYRFFPGLREHHSFAQFRNHFHRPDIIRDLIAGRPVTRPSITLLAPPTVEFEARPDPSGTGRVDLSFDLRGSAQLRTLRLFRDGLPLTELPVSGNTARLAHTIQLQPGRHNISAVAYDAQGFSSNVKTAAVQIGQDRRYNGRLRYVGIAVNDYHRMPDQNLGLAVRDAQLLRDSLQGLRSPRRGEVTATVLTDAQATRTAILETLRRAATETGPDDTLVISFAGHGARVGERFFYLPHGGSFADAADSGVEWRLIADALSPAQGRVLVLLDACHSGSASGDNFVPNDAYAEQLMRSGRSGLAVLAASKGRQFSYEDPSLGNGGQGQFTYAIAQALGPDRARADRDRSGTIELDELYAYVKRTVSNSTRANQTGVQTPWLARDEFIGRVSFF
ncbi:Caspase domain-containing protein [Falsiroseomonas stagni DSM 19981]|uniref:Caspase domain-containing protein n=2 Tax=Falsiroseomonas TaxID=2870713 RepID=A0A1I4FH47_9PROT|nr:Caspase domain-containing protein [Falsiroseomonas stagni DSM 19981]